MLARRANFKAASRIASLLRTGLSVMPPKKSSSASSSSPSDPPASWREVYDNILEMRKARDAPVDSMGCERSFDPDATPKVQRFQTLVSLLLSSQTKDEVNYAAMTRLKRHGLTVENVIATDEKDLAEIIKPVGFWKTKAGYLKRTCAILQRDYDGDIPDSVEDLCKLPGIGPKMAYLCMNIAWKKQAGIGVDTHVHRISNRLGWTGAKGTKQPEETRRALESWLPEDRWTEINWLLVGFGQQTCLPVAPKCKDCLNNKLCPFGVARIKTMKG